MAMQDKIKVPLHYALLAIILLCSGYLIFKNLSDAALWDDEAETSIIAENFLESGHFTGWNGHDLLSLRNGSLLDKNLNDRNPPMQFILTAASFSLFGVNNFTARLPFAIIGLLTIILLYLTLRMELPERPTIALYGAVFLGLFTEYILYTRTCRYYSIACFAALLTFFAYRCFARHANLKTALGLAASAIFLYYSHFQICIAFLIPLALLHILFEQKQPSKSHWIYVSLVCLLFTLAVLPYTIIHSPWERPDMPQTGSCLTHFTILLWFLRDGLMTGMAPWSVLMASVVLIMTRPFDRQIKHLMKLAFIILMTHIALIGFTSGQVPLSDPNIFMSADIRYLVACFPFTAILVAGILQWLHQKNKILALFLALLVIGTNISYSLPWQKPHYAFPTPLVYSPLYRYIREIHGHYVTAIQAVSEFLKNNARQHTTYYAFPEHFNEPLKFYVGSQLYNCCTLDTNTHLGAARVKKLSPFLLINENFPDWLIVFGFANGVPKLVQYFARTIVRNDAPFNYEYWPVKDLSVYCEETNRPEIFCHHFGNVTDFDPGHHVFILRKVKGR